MCRLSQRFLSRAGYKKAHLSCIPITKVSNRPSCRLVVEDASGYYNLVYFTSTNTATLLYFCDASAVYTLLKRRECATTLCVPGYDVFCYLMNGWYNDQYTVNRIVFLVNIQVFVLKFTCMIVYSPHNVHQRSNVLQCFLQ